MGISSLDKNLNACNLFLSAVTPLDILLQKQTFSDKKNDMKIQVNHKETKIIDIIDACMSRYRNTSINE